MKQEEIDRRLNLAKALLTGHFVYTSGRHGSAYFNKDAIYPDTQLISAICRQLASRFVKDRIEVVIGPEKGAIIISQLVSFHLSVYSGSTILSVYAEKAGDEAKSFVIKRGYDRLIEGRRGLVVEDVLNTGNSVRKVVEVARSCGCEVVGVAAICNRGNVIAEMLGNVSKLSSLYDMPLASWPAENCPLCAKGVPINTDVGKGREFLSRQT